MEIAASHHTDPDNDQARYRYKEIPGILLAFIIHLSCTNHQQTLLNCPDFQPQEITIQCAVVERWRRSHEEWEEGGGIVGVLIMPDNAEQHN